MRAPSSCPDATSLSDLVNGLLRLDVAARLRAHLAACTACLQVTAALLVGAPPQAPPRKR